MGHLLKTNLPLELFCKCNEASTSAYLIKWDTLTKLSQNLDIFYKESNGNHGQHRAAFFLILWIGWTCFNDSTHHGIELDKAIRKRMCSSCCRYIALFLLICTTGLSIVSISTPYWSNFSQDKNTTEEQGKEINYCIHCKK